MARKVDKKTVGEINELLQDALMAFGHTSGSGLVGVINEADLTLPQLLILEFLRQGQQTVTGLSEMLRLTPGAVSRLVDRLVRKGLVSRKEGDGDRRQKRLTLTPAGRRLSERFERARTGSFIDALSDIEPALAAEFKNVMARVVASLRSRAAADKK